MIKKFILRSVLIGFTISLIVSGYAYSQILKRGDDTCLFHNHVGEFTESDTNSKFYFKEVDYKDSLPYYEQLFGARKDVPDSLKLAFYVALRQYPELYNRCIKMESCTMFTTMEARPTKMSVFKKKKNRTYKIYINNRKGKNKGLNLAKLNFNMRVGFFGHELAHLASYEARNGWQLATMGIKYVCSKNYKRYTERWTDMETIKRGLGYALYESKKFILYGNQDDVPEDYRANSHKNYMTETEIIDAILHRSFANVATQVR